MDKASNYINVVYNTETRPHTNYPLALCNYLSKRFDITGGAKILDVGCGRGDFAKGFKDMGADVYGLDAIKIDSPLLKSIKIQYADLEKDLFPYEDNVFDVVFSKSVIEHLVNPENFMRQCYRVLKPKGRIIIMTPDWISQMQIFYDDYTHKQPYTVCGLSDMLRIFSFKNVCSELFYQLPMIWKYPGLKIASNFIRIFIPVTLKSKNKFIRWSTELMLLGTGIK